MFIYKIGQHYYQNLNKVVDKNSGLFESNMIKDEFTQEEKDDRKDLAVIVGGILSFEDKEYLEEKLHNYKKKVFIATDYSMFHSCLDLANSCDLVLHQAKVDIPIITTKQEYGYMPELFFKETEKPTMQHELIIFGGNNLNRQDLINKYVLNKDGKVNERMFTLIKNYDTMEDNRLEYSEYIKLLRMFRYSLIIARKEYRDLHWTTSRFVESISNWVYPIVDKDYDLSGHFLYEESFGISNRVSDYNDVMKIMLRDILRDKRSDKKDEYIIDCQNKIRNDRSKFKELILNA